MRTVNIVVGTADLSWIAGRLARELEFCLPAYGWKATINGPKADLEYQQIVYGPPTSRPAVGLFTHGEDRPRKFATAYDGAVALNPVIAKALYTYGARNPVVIEQAVDGIFHRRVSEYVFGVAGSTKADGRKGEALVKQMKDAGYTVLGHGSGWPCPIVSADYATLPDFYRMLDYYVVTSSDEGGCTPILEAAAMAVPVISPKIGFAIRRPVLEYKAGDWASLHAVLRSVTEHRTYDDWAKEHARYFDEVMEQVSA